MGGRRYNREEGGNTTPASCSPRCLPSPSAFRRSLLDADSSSMNCSLPRKDLSSRNSSSSSTPRSRGSSKTDDPVLSLHLFRATLLRVALPPDVLPLGDNTVCKQLVERRLPAPNRSFVHGMILPNIELQDSPPLSHSLGALSSSPLMPNLRHSTPALRYDGANLTCHNTGAFVGQAPSSQ